MYRSHPRSISRSTDITRLEGILSDLYGKKFCKAELSYGGDLRLHFGQLVASRHAELRGLKQGAYILSTCGTAWRVYTRMGLVSSKTTSESHWEEKVAGSISRGMIAGLGLVFPMYDLVTKFGNDCRFEITPDSDDNDSDVPAWELFMPNHMLVSFDPRGYWSYKRSNIPMRSDDES